MALSWETDGRPSDQGHLLKLFPLKLGHTDRARGGYGHYHLRCWIITPVQGNLYLSDSLKCKSWKKGDEGMETQPRTGGFISLSRLPAFWRGARNAVGCEMFLFRFIGFVQPSPNRGCHFQGGKSGVLCSEHLRGTVAGKGSFPVALTELDVAGFIYIFFLKKLFFFFKQYKLICWLEL